MQAGTRKWTIFVSVSLLLVLMNVDVTAVNLALAPIAVDLHLNIASVQSIVSAYLIGGASLVMLGGLLGDIYGHRKIFLLGAIIFTIASLGTGLSSSQWSIIAMRLFQGFGAALAWPLAIVIVRETFAPNEGFAMGLIAGVMGASMSIGPPLGGVILSLLNWRWIFFINIPLGILVILIGFSVLPKPKIIHEEKNVDLTSALILFSGLLLFVYGLNELQRQGIRSPLIISPLIIGIILIGFFIYRQTKIKQPLIDLTLFRNLALSACFLVRLFWQILWVGIFLIGSLLFQNILGYSALQTSVFFLVNTVTFAIVAPIGGKLCERFTPRTLILIAFLFFIATFTGYAVITPNSSVWTMGFLFLLFGIGMGVGFPSLLNGTLALAPPNKKGMVSGILYACLFTGGSIGAIFVGSLIGAAAPQKLQQLLQTWGLHLNQSMNKTLMAASTGVRNIFQLTLNVKSHESKLLIALVQQSFFYALEITMIISIAICVLTAGIACLITRR